MYSYQLKKIGLSMVESKGYLTGQSNNFLLIELFTFHPEDIVFSLNDHIVMEFILRLCHTLDKRK